MVDVGIVVVALYGADDRAGIGQVILQAQVMAATGRRQ